MCLICMIKALPIYSLNIGMSKKRHLKMFSTNYFFEFIIEMVDRKGEKLERHEIL